MAIVFQYKQKYVLKIDQYVLSLQYVPSTNDVEFGVMVSTPHLFQWDLTVGRDKCFPQQFSELLGSNVAIQPDDRGVLALPISDYEQRQVRLLDRSQDRRKAISSFVGKSGVSYSN